MILVLIVSHMVQWSSYGHPMQTGHLDLDDVRLFTEVVQAGSFTKASRKLGIPKSTVSRRVGELEDRLGVLLLQRTTRKLHLTHAGELYFARTARIMDELEDAEKALAELQSEPRGLLRITTPSDLSGALPPLLSAFQDQYPLVELVVFPTGRRVDLIAEGFDLALRAGSAVDSNLVARTLLKSHLSIVASPSYLAKHGAPTCLEDLSQHRCVVFSNQSVEGTWDLVGPDGGVNQVPVKGRFAARDFGILRAAVLRGEGLGFLPLLSFGADLRSGALVRVLSEYRSPESALRAVFPSKRHLSPKVRAFVDFAATWLEEHRPDSVGCP